MNEPTRDTAPSAEEIERKFRSLGVIAARPALRGTAELLKMIRGYDWQAHFECDLSSLDPPLIFAANHRSHVDTAAILDTLPAHLRRRTAVAAALDVFGRNRNGGWRRRVSKDFLQFVVAAGFHAYAFDRLGPPLRSVRTSVQLIRNDWNLLLYPEGTRSRTRDMNLFKPGVSLLAKFSGRPVIPIHVDGGERVLPYRALVPRPGMVNVRYGEPLSYSCDDTPLSFAARVEFAVRELAVRQPVQQVPTLTAASLAQAVPNVTPQAAGMHSPY